MTFASTGLARDRGYQLLARSREPWATPCPTRGKLKGNQSTLHDRLRRQLSPLVSMRKIDSSNCVQGAKYVYQSKTRIERVEAAHAGPSRGCIAPRAISEWSSHSPLSAVSATFVVGITWVRHRDPRRSEPAFQGGAKRQHQALSIQPTERRPERYRGRLPPAGVSKAMV